MTHALTTPSMIRLPSFAAAELEAYVKASNTGERDFFGGSVAFSGDTLVVSAGGEDSSATGINGDQSNNDARWSGAVYVFTRTDGVWSQEAYLKASNAGPDDHFGVAVALSGNTLVVGAHNEHSGATGINGDQLDDSAIGSGAVYVFTRTDGVWSQEAYLKASNTGGQDQFGISVAISGDTLVVGAHSEDSGATGINGDQPDNSSEDSGAVYVFTRTDGVWSQEAYLKASNAGPDDHFGGAVALSGNTLVVGAQFEGSSATGINGDQLDDSAIGSGAVYVFTRTDGLWSQEAYLKASNTNVGDQFGSSVALSDGDLSGITLAVGAHNEDSGATGINGDQFDNSDRDSGAVYVFRRPSGIVTQTIPPSTISREWKQQLYVKASNTGKDDGFGASVALSGDTLVVGAGGEDSSATGINGEQFDNSASDSGAVYVYHATK